MREKMTTTSYPTQYYIEGKKSYLKDFDRITKSARAVLETHFDRQKIPTMLAEARQGFEDLLPQLPYLGGEKPFTDFVVFTAMSLAFYRVCTAHGKSLEQFAAILYQIERDSLMSTPKFMLRLFGPRNFHPSFLEKARQRALETQQRQYPENYVFEFVEGDGINFDYGIDYLECGACKFLASQGASELAPYICPADILYSQLLGWGLSRTQTIAEGAERCDFRFKKGGPTNVAVPPAMQAVVSEAD
jgi:hypothetical protein